MAVILRSSIGKTAGHAFSLEGGLSAHLPRPHRRLLQTLQTPDSTSHSQVDPLVRRIDEVARSAVLAEYAQGLVKEHKSQVVSSTLLGISMPWLIGICSVGVFATGFYRGFDEATKKGYQESARKGLKA
ncbi:unnamed protein product [Urochloa humidicola]